ncbi:MAG: hypothetical protein JXB85_12065 [Anaerolineales bacterium]|nr:hypothetical protein [Anaerolineales bacterium]
MNPSAAALGAGFRYSTYGPPSDPGPAYWAAVGEQMAARFDGATPQAIWIVGIFTGNGTYLSFPAETDDPLVTFTYVDMNEATLDLFDERGLQVWLQVEPGHADIPGLIDQVLGQYSQHPCVIGFGVDVEWFQSDGSAEGTPVTDAQARQWVAAVRRHDRDYLLFLKHWDPAYLPPTERDGLVFVDDSQQFESFEQMVAEFSAWGRHFAPAAVGFQYGYPADRHWWSQLADPPGDIGRAILENVPNTSALFWVDFTVLEVFPPGP